MKIRDLDYKSQLGIVMLLTSILFFGYDLIEDMLDHLLSGSGYSSGQLVHLVFEILAFLALLYSLNVVYQHHQLTSNRAETADTAVTAYQEGADSLLRRKFREISLTNAEEDVLLFILKGLSPAEIAEVRGTAVGTVKTQTTSIFRKLNVKSRAELLSVLLHEILDIEALQNTGNQPGRT